MMDTNLGVMMNGHCASPSPALLLHGRDSKNCTGRQSHEITLFNRPRVIGPYCVGQHGRFSFGLVNESSRGRWEGLAMIKQQDIASLDDFIRSEYFAAWDESNRASLGYSRLPFKRDRCERIYDGAEHGAEGSTHGEIIADWREAFDCFQRDLQIAPLSDETVSAIEKEINDCETWHEKNGSLETQLG